MPDSGDVLQLVSRNDECSLYRLDGPYAPKVTRYIASTPYTRKICNDPACMGSEFRRAMAQAAAAILRAMPEADSFRAIAPERMNVLHFLRGGLSFGVMKGLEGAYGINEHRASFMTSERARDEKGRWYIREDQYVKLTLADESVVFLGDIVATGVTVAAAFAKLFEQTSGLPRHELPCAVADQLFYGISWEQRQALLHKAPGETKRIPLRRIVFFTIGCHKAEKVMAQYDALLRQVFPEYEGSIVIYLEGKFHLADSKTKLRIVEQGTDLLRWPALLAPEFERSQFDHVRHLLEPCTIYDGGSRSFDATKHRGDVVKYWSEVSELCDEGFGLREALRERWPKGPYDAGKEEFVARRGELWKGLEPGFLEDCWEAHARFWQDCCPEGADGPEPLKALAEKQIEAFRN